MEKFKDINADPDTIIQSYQFLKIDKIDCKHEMWVWDGIEAESLIFCTNELESTDEMGNGVDYGDYALGIVYDGEKYDEVRHSSLGGSFSVYFES